MQLFTPFLACLVFFASISHTGPQPLDPGDSTPSSNTVPAYPTQTQTQICRLDLSNELFGGVNDACGTTLDRSRCCPVLAAWLFAAHARRALEVSAPAPPPSSDLPMMPDDSQKCVNSLQDSLRNRSIRIPQPNATCDAILCFCGIRLHQITSLSCPNAFNVTAFRNASGTHNATPTAAVRNLENNCRNASYAGCTKCLNALQKIKGNKKENESERAKKMFNRDCQLMALTWLLGRNKTAYIPTVSAVLRAVMYSAHPHESKCSPDQENMPLAVDSLQFETSGASSSPLRLFWIMLVSVIVLVFSARD
ncbi:putative GPI-anchored protein, partial [Mucuna pruriens]